PAIRVTLPVFNQGQGEIDRQRSTLRRLHAEYEAAGVHVRAAARVAAGRLANARARATFAHEVQLPLAQRVVEQSLEQYDAMQIGVFQVVQVRRQQIEAATAYVRALHEYWHARAAVNRILAGGSADVAQD